MHRLIRRLRSSEFFAVFHYGEEEAAGRCSLLWNTILANIANVFSTGLFYTGFLAINGIDIVNVGIITFIPYIAWAFSLFSPMILSRFKRRRALLIFNGFFYHICITLGTTLIPLFIKDTGTRTVCFAVLVFLGNVMNALLGSGATAWHVRFLPETIRHTFFSYNNLFGAVFGAGTALASSFLADAVTGSPRQAEILFALRFIAFAIVTVNILQLFLVPKEYEYVNTVGRFSLKDVFTIPLKNRAFALTLLVAFLWNALSNMNINTWNYYAIHTAGYGYAFLNTGTVSYAVFSLLLLSSWRRAVNRYTWFKVFLFTILTVALLEFLIGFSTASTLWVYVTVTTLQGCNAVGLNLVFASLFFLNLPREDNDVYSVLWNCLCNIGVLAGSLLGTLFLSLTEGHTWQIIGLAFYGSQFLVWIKAVLLVLLAFFIYRIKRRMLPPSGLYGL